MRRSLFFSFVVLALLAGCQSPTSTDTKTPPAPAPVAAGSITLKNGSTTGLTLSAYDPADTAVKPKPVATAPLVAAGQTVLITAIPAGKDFWFHALDDLVPGTDYSLVISGAPKVFRLSPLRAYNLDFTLDSTAASLMVWQWQLASNPLYEVSNLKVTPGTNSLTLTWKDPAMADLVSIQVTPQNGTPVTVSAGVQTVTLSGLTAQVPKAVTVAVVYPEVTSRGLATTGTPLAPVVVDPPVVSLLGINSTYPFQNDTMINSLPGTITVEFTADVDPATVTADTFQVLAATNPVAGSFAVTGKTVVFTPAAMLVPGTKHTVNVTKGIKSVAGVAHFQDYLLSFTTASATAVTVSRTTPGDGDLRVPTSPREISASFSTTIYQPSVTADSFVLSDGPNVVPGLITTSYGSVTFAPSAPLLGAHVYTATVKAGIRGITGGTLAADYHWSFTTEPDSLFQDTVVLPLALQTQATAVGDVNGDGKPDLLGLTVTDSTSSLSNKLVVYLQTAGGWADPVSYPTTTAVNGGLSSLALGDVNGDGKNEVLVAERNGIEIFAQNGTGGLSLSTKLVSTNSYAVRVADLNNDKRMDVAAIGWGTSTVSVWLQKANGTLATAVTYAVPHEGWDSLAVGDLNADGLTDLVVQNGQGYASLSFYVLTQNLSGTFQPAVGYLIAANTLVDGLAIGDFNGDGKNDSVVSFGGNTGKVGLFAQGSGGTLGTPVVTSAGDVPGALDSADFNGDGRQDLLINYGGGYVGVLLQASNGTFDPLMRYTISGPSAGNTPAPMAVADLNADGKPDVVVALVAGLGILLNK